MSTIRSIRPFIGSKDFEVSRQFYQVWGFEEMIISNGLSFFYFGQFGFYLQDYYSRSWADNSMVFLEVEDLASYWADLKSRKLEEKFDKVKLVDPQHHSWGSEAFVHDPSNILWHIGELKVKQP